MYIKIFIFILFLFLVGCSPNENVKRGGLAPEVSDKFDPRGHIVEDYSGRSLPFGNEIAPIPNISSLQAINIKPSAELSRHLYSVSAINVPVAEILYKLAVDSGKGLSLHSSVAGNVTINAINQPLENILRGLVEQVSAIYEISNFQITIKPDLPYWKTYRVNYVNMKKASKDSIALSMTIGSGAGGSGTEVTMMSDHDFWGTLETNLLAKSQFNAIASGEASVASAMSANVAVNREAGLVSIYTLANRHKLIQKYLSKIDYRTNKQVLIEATVVEVLLFDEYQAGIDWSGITANSGNVSAVQNVIGASFAGGASFNLNIGGNFNLVALQRFGDTKVLSSPRIMAVSNQTALLKVVNNEVYFTTEATREAATATSPAITTFETTLHTVPVGFMMSLTPFITENNEVSINVRPTLSRIIRHVTDPNPDLRALGVENLIPVIQEREMSTVLHLRNRQTAVIGGLIQDEHSNEREGVPWLSSLPIVGDLFVYREDKVRKTELVIFIRPIIIDNPDVSHGDLQSLQPFLQTQTLNFEKQ